MRWAERRVRWREAVAAVVIVGCGLGAFRSVLPPALAEAIVLLAILAVPLASPALIGVMRPTPIAQRAAWVGIVAAVLIGHFHGKVYDTFPFVTWDIYQSPPSGEMLLFDYHAVRGDGSEEHLVPADLFPALRKKVAVHLEQVAGAIESTADTTPADQARRMELMQRYDTLLRALARAYNRTHADHPLTAIRIERWSVPIERYAGRESIVRHPVRVWRLEREAE